jgi:hypothetical protein
MSEEPDIDGIRRDGFGIAKDLLNDPRLQNALERLRSRIKRAVTSTGEKIDNVEAKAAFEKALVDKVVEGLKEAVNKVT